MHASFSNSQYNEYGNCAVINVCLCMQFVLFNAECDGLCLPDVMIRANACTQIINSLVATMRVQ